MARTAGSKNNAPTPSEGFNILSVVTEASDEPVNSRAGASLKPETLMVMDWLRLSHEKGDGTYGAPRKVVIPAGNTEYVVNLLHRAAANLNSGIDKEVTNLAGGQVEVKFRTRPKRERKPAATPAA